MTGMDSWIIHALLVAGLVIHGSNAEDISGDDEDYNVDGMENNYNMFLTVSVPNVFVPRGTDRQNLDFYEDDYSHKIESLDTTSVTINSITNLTTVHTTSLQATPPKHSPTPNLSPQGKSHTGWLLLALGIVLLLCTALLVSTIMLACQVWKLHDQLSSVFPAQPLRVNADVIRVRKASEVMETEMEKMMEEAGNTAEKTLHVDADAQETEATVVPTAPPADPSSDCVLNV